jgi:hypothetical protein
MQNLIQLFRETPMSRESDLDAIMRLLPQPPGAKPEDSRLRLERLSDRELSETRASLVSISEQEPSPKWGEALKKVRDLSELQPLLAEWEKLDEHVRAQGWLGAR